MAAPAAPASPDPAVDTRPWAERHHRALVNGSRTALVMLVIAALVLLGFGLVAWLRADPSTEPVEISGWLRSVFGTVFAVVALGLAAVIGIPSAVGLWAMAGATKPDAEPALSPRVRRILVIVAVATIAVTVAVLVLTGSALLILNLGLAGLVSLASLGLAGAASFSPHRGRASTSGIALVLVSAGTLWVVSQAFIGAPG